MAEIELDNSMSIGVELIDEQHFAKGLHIHACVECYLCYIQRSAPLSEHLWVLAVR